MIETLNRIFEELGLEYVRAGRLVCETKDAIPDPATALKEFLGTDGSGWLHCALHPQIFRFGPQEPLPANDDYWPLRGEWVKEATSRHLRRTNKGWAVTVITEAEASDAVLVPVRHVGHGGGYTLDYEVCWAPDKDTQALRPCAARFVGFGRVTASGSAAQASAVLESGIVGATVPANRSDTSATA